MKAPTAAALSLLLLAAVPLAAQEAPETVPTDPGPPPVRVLRTGGLRVETAALLMSGQEGGTIPVATLVVPQPSTAGRSRVSVVLEIDGAEALAGQTTGQTGDVLRLEVCLYAITSGSAPASPSGGPAVSSGITATTTTAGALPVSTPSATPGGRVAASRMDTVEVDLASRGAELEEGGLKYVGELDLPPGDYALRVLVRNAATSEVGLRSIPLTIPDFAKRRGLLLPPLMVDPGNLDGLDGAADAWLTARGAGIPASPPSFSLDALPSARPILAPDVKTELRIAAWKLDEPGLPGLKIEIRRPGGARVGTFPLEIAGREAGSVPGLEILTASFVPKDLEDGVYDLRAVLAEGRAEGRGDDAAIAAILSTSIVVLQNGGGGQVWAALTPSRRAQAAQASVSAGGSGGADGPAQARRGKKVRKIDAGPVKAAYRKALTLLAGDDREGARTAVMAMEASVLGGERPASSEELMGVELDVANDLARSDSGILIPLLTLHQVIYRDAVRKQSYLVSTHDRELVFRLIALYAQRNPSPEGRREAGRFLYGLAAEMTENAPPSLRARLFQQILALDATDATALLCLAVDAERQGRYAEAVGLLERLSKLHPGHAEARLRLGVNLVRIGKVRDARRVLAEVSGLATAEPWQVAVAAQEQTRVLIAAGDLAGAEAAIQEGLKRLPDDDKLALQLGLIRDLRKDPRGARDAVARIGKTEARLPRNRGSSGSGGVARNRYNSMPFEALDRAWSDLQKSALDHIPALAAALGVPAGTAADSVRNTP